MASLVLISVSTRAVFNARSHDLDFRVLFAGSIFIIRNRCTLSFSCRYLSTLSRSGSHNRFPNSKVADIYPIAMTNESLIGSVSFEICPFVVYFSDVNLVFLPMTLLDIIWLWITLYDGRPSPINSLFPRDELFAFTIIKRIYGNGAC